MKVCICKSGYCFLRQLNHQLIFSCHCCVLEQNIFTFLFLSCFSFPRLVSIAKNRLYSQLCPIGIYIIQITAYAKSKV